MLLFIAGFVAGAVVMAAVGFGYVLYANKKGSFE